ncbi:Ail/Lom family outer membrane beta-barrel protein [Salmonella enterica]|nr:Ail/Lom family outer membrane beta-barrel protein [Salmonella enterica]
MNKLFIAVVLMSVIAGVDVANAATGDSTFSVGWAQIHSDGLRDYMGKNFNLSSDVKKQLTDVVKNGGKAGSAMDRYKNLNGFNIKYRYEFNDEWGVISSFTFAQASFEGDYHLSKSSDNYYISESHIKNRYFNVMAGPVYRFNDYISLYSMVGVANNRIEGAYNKNDHSYYGSAISYEHENQNQNTTNVSYGVGIQTNPFENVVFDVAYEGSAGSARTNGFNVGLGYKF